jgi:hypothetical protein
MPRPDVRFGSKAGISLCNRHVRFTLGSGHVRCNYGCPLWSQKRTSAFLFDHHVGARKQRGRHREAERLCGLEVDHEIKSGWLFYWQVSGLAAL